MPLPHHTRLFLLNHEDSIHANANRPLEIPIGASKEEIAKRCMEDLTVTLDDIYFNDVQICGVPERVLAAAFAPIRQQLAPFADRPWAVEIIAKYPCLQLAQHEQALTIDHAQELAISTHATEHNHGSQGGPLLPVPTSTDLPENGDIAPVDPPTRRARQTLVTNSEDAVELSDSEEAPPSKKHKPEPGSGDEDEDEDEDEDVEVERQPLSPADPKIPAMLPGETVGQYVDRVIVAGGLSPKDFIKAAPAGLEVVTRYLHLVERYNWHREMERQHLAMAADLEQQMDAVRTPSPVTRVGPDTSQAPFSDSTNKL
ncbi:hypothetical protein EIP86_007688 [Pleurotus ostreatoroseus]|nr:hypothetical protein EIP86_007688 [Pleurotus ostreatoroseus]